jgi:hypothetical protein
MINFLTYGDNKYEKSKKRIYDEAKKMNIFDKYHILSKSDMPNDLPELTKKILNMPRGGGYWIWKPILVKKVLEEMNNNDILIYADSGCTININGKDRLNNYINMVKDENKPLLRFQMDISENKYTNSAIFEHFKVTNRKDITESGQYMATTFIIRKCDLSIKIIDYWYKTAIKYPLLFSDHFNNYNRNSVFIDNRHDQSIFSIITKIFKNNCNTLNDSTFPYDINEPICATRIRG